MGSHAELVTSLYEALDRHDFEAAYELLADDVVWSVPNSDWPAAGTYHGHHGVREFCRRHRAIFDEYAVEREPFVEAGDVVVVPMHVRARRRVQGNVLDAQLADVLTVRHGRVASAEVFVDRERALARAGD